MVLLASPRQISCFFPASYRSTINVPTEMVEVSPCTVAEPQPPQPLKPSRVPHKFTLFSSWMPA